MRAGDWVECLARHRSPIGSSLSDQNRFGLPPESRSAADAEPRLQSLVLFPVFQRCPDEQATDENGGQADEQDKNDRGGAVHVCKSFPPSGISSPPKLPPVSFPLLGVGRSAYPVDGRTGGLLLRHCRLGGRSLGRHPRQLEPANTQRCPARFEMKRPAGRSHFWNPWGA